jgi:hypothetical protein
MNTEQGITGSSNTHARLSPSDSKRWSNCLASIAFQEANAHRVRKDDGSIYADEGTEAHEWAAKVLLKQCTIEEVPEKGMLDNDLRIHVAAYVEHCLATVPEGVSYEVEVQVPLYYQPEQTGTCDFACVTEDRITIRDYKHGGGVLVTSADNSQLAIYAFSLVKLYEDLFVFGPETIIDIHAFQPRHREGADQPHWETTLADLTSFCWNIELQAIAAREGAERVREKIGAPGRDVSPDEILEAAPGLVFHPEEGDGGSCRWCKCKSWCPKRLSASLEDLDTPVLNAEDMLAVMPDLDKKELKLPTADRVHLTAERLGLSSLGDDYLVKLYRAKKGITRFLEDVEEALEGRLLDGEEIDGVQLVMGREGNRAWANEEAADTFLAGQKISADDRYTRKVISPSAAEKLLKEKELSKRAQTRFNELVTRSPAKRVIALADDKRPAITAPVSALPDLDEPEFE